MLTLSGGAFRDDIHTRFEALGYTVTHKLVNAADFGIPQNRQRVFFVGLKNKEFIFPKEHEKKLTCSDALSDMPDINEENGMSDFISWYWPRFANVAYMPANSCIETSAPPRAIEIP